MYSLNSFATIPAQYAPYSSLFRATAGANPAAFSLRQALPLEDTSNRKEIPPSPSVSADTTSPVFKRIYSYLGPYEAITLFSAGFASSFALMLVLRSLFASGIKPKIKPTEGPLKNPLNSLMNNAHEVQDQVGTFFDGNSPVNPIVFALRNADNPTIQRRLSAYLAYSVVGYLMGSLFGGWQEVLVRKEETQIRADLISRLTGNFRASITHKSAMDNQLRESAKRQILEVLTQCRVPAPEELLKPTPDAVVDKAYQQFPYVPFNFSLPTTTHFGQQANPATPLSLDPGQLTGIKSVTFVLGLIAGTLLQSILYLLQSARHVADVAPDIQDKTKTMFLRVFNLRAEEAVFLTAEKPLLLTILGITAITKIGKLMVDGYREIEVTRRNANTELRYQTYNWLQLDPTYHGIAEEEALQDAIQKLREALPYEYNNRKALASRIQTILTNVGRNSAPKYFPMTPMVNLVAARS